MFVVGSLILVGLLAVTSANPFAHQCGPHQEWNQCGSECSASCDNPTPVCPETRSCTPGCYCRTGYVFDGLRVCVPSRRCGYRRRRKCGHNEKWKRCRRTCEPTCKRRKPRDCREPCLDYGCQCRSGFVRDRHGDCIPYDLCPYRKNHCRRNEYYSNETSLNDTKCQQPRCPDQSFPKNCPRYTTNGGCKCKDGYLRTKWGKCVKPDECHRHSSSDSRSRSRSHSSSRSWSRSRSHSRSRSSESDDSDWSRSRSRSSDRSSRSWSRDRSSWDSGSSENCRCHNRHDFRIKRCRKICGRWSKSRSSSSEGCHGRRCGWRRH